MTTLRLVVTDVDDTVPLIRSVTLAAPDAGELPGFVAGSHLAIGLGARTNPYSLTGDGVAPTAYTISVLRVVDGLGGSAHVHDELQVGDVVEAQVPRSAFAPVARASRHLLVAGGIGVTPIVSHLRAARTWGRRTQVIYSFREGYAAHVDDVLELADEAELVTDGPEVLMARLEKVLCDQPLGTHLYVCGPGPMIDAVTAAALEAGWPVSRIHSERFGTDTLDPGEPFTVRVSGAGAGDGAVLQVPSGSSILETLEQAGVQVPNLCRQGVCGECRLEVTGGTPLHRDLFLSDDERASGTAVMACVSRCIGPALEVAL